MPDLKAAAEVLAPELRAEIERLYAAEAALRTLQDAHCDLLLQHHRAQAIAGDRSAELASLRGRFDELGPDQFAIARRDAIFLGQGWIRVTARGRLRFDVERVAPGRVSLRGDERGAHE